MIKDRPLCTVCLAVFMMLTVCVHGGGAHLIRELRPSPLEREAAGGDEVVAAGRVYRTENRQTYQILYVKDSSIHLNQQSLNESRILIYDNSITPVKIGNRILIKGEVSFFDKPRNPGNFDQKLYYQKQDIHARIWADTVTVKDNTIFRIRNTLNEFRQRWKQVLLDRMGREEGGALSAMMLGDKADMDQDLKELYQVNGIGHILAISGLHLSFIGLGLYRVIRRGTGSFLAAGIGGILFLLCYIVMIGFTISAVRALVMFLFRVGADVTGRYYDAPTALAVAAVTVMIWRPLSIYDGGFWLSFGAVLGILVIRPIFDGLPFGGIWAGISINLAILPVICCCFYEFPLYSLLLNLIIIPLMSLVLLSGMAGSLLSLLAPGAGKLLFFVCSAILNVYEQSCNMTLVLPASRIVTGHPAWWQMAVYYIFLAVCILLWKDKNKVHRQRKGISIRRRIIAAVILSAAGMAVFVIPPLLRPGQHMEITVLDVGQGDGIFIRDAKGAACLVDGGSSDVKEVGRYRIEPFLKYKGIRQMDYVFITHGDSDHMNGIEEMIERKKTGIPIKRLVLPPERLWDDSLRKLSAKARHAGIKVLIMEKGDIINTGKLSISCLHPEKDDPEGPGNEASLVLSLQFKRFTMLLTGDIEGEGERRLTDQLRRQNPKRTYDILKAAHHGSRNSSSEEFLDEAHPRYAVISAGRDNRYGHPHKETMERLKDCECAAFSTQDRGAVTITVDGVRFSVHLMGNS